MQLQIHSAWLRLGTSQNRNYKKATLTSTLALCSSKAPRHDIVLTRTDSTVLFFLQKNQAKTRNQRFRVFLLSQSLFTLLWLRFVSDTRRKARMTWRDIVSTLGQVGMLH